MQGQPPPNRSSDCAWTPSEQPLVDSIDPTRLPRHIAIIMDGNGRWAKSQNKARVKGHLKGADVVSDIVRACRNLGVKYLTVYAFSEENWSRPALEINALMKLLEVYLLRKRSELMKNGVRLATIGNRDKLPSAARKLLEKTMSLTKDNKDMVFTLALSYSGRDEIVRGVRELVTRQVRAEDIDADLVASVLDTRDYPDPDLLIRTSGEERISNFMLWQLAYTELYITNTLWPDFTPTDLLKAVIDFQKRKRRFGGVSDKTGPMPKTLPGGAHDA